MSTASDSRGADRTEARPEADGAGSAGGARTLPRGAHLHFDCASGAAGDMTLGALIDAGVPIAVIRDTLDQLGVGGWRLSATRVSKRGIRAIDVRVALGEHPPDDPHGGEAATGAGGDGHGHAHGEHGHTHDGHGHTHDGHGHTHDGHGHEHGGHEHTHDGHEHGHDHDGHGHDHGPHRAYREIRASIVAAGLDPAVTARALDMFDRVARAEALIHQSSLDEVVFHEVGAIDSIVDIVGTAAALAWLDPASVSAASVATGHGTVRCAHGVLPVPAPAALEILREAGAVSEGGGLARELCTPTGAAILAAAVDRWAPMPPAVPIAVGYGAGDSELPDRANVLRVIVADARAGRAGRASAGQPLEGPAVAADGDPASGQLGGDSMWRIEANIDDMSAELCEHAAEAAFAAGAVDVWWTPIVMKKGRPALLMAALCPGDARDSVVSALLRETTTIGVRYDQVARRVLARELVTVDTEFGPLPIKLGWLDGALVNVAPEYEACRAAAQAAGVALKRVFAAALVASEARRAGEDS